VAIPAGGFLLVFASGQEVAEPSSALHANFKLDADGEYLALIGPDGHTIEFAYAPEYPHQAPGVSYGLSGDFSVAGYFAAPTPGEPNHTELSGKPPTPPTGPVTLVLAREAKFISDTLTRLMLLLLVVSAVTVPALVLILCWGVRRSLRSLDELAAQISQLRAGDLDEVVCLSRCPHELQPVVGRLNQLLQQLHAVLERERGFASDVAHELRTPLAALLLKMDLALSRQRPPSEYQALVGDCREIAAQMQGMIEKLLVLARLDSARMTVQPEPLVLDDVIGEAWKPLADIARQRGLSVHWSLQPRLRLVTDRTQLGLSIRNLLENAVAHSDPGGSVRVKSGCVNGRVELEVGNSGSRVAMQDTDDIFQRFWRGDAARSDVGVHSGLGLPITKRMVEFLGGSVTARSCLGGDFEVTIQLPAKPSAGHGGGSAA
jgi:two-component system heavy metal sensor histidine kinase CusS